MCKFCVTPVGLTAAALPHCIGLINRDLQLPAVAFVGSIRIGLRRAAKLRCYEQPVKKSCGPPSAEWPRTIAHVEGLGKPSLGKDHCHQRTMS